MSQPPSSDNLQDALDSFLTTQGEERSGKMSELMALMKRAKARKKQKDLEEESGQNCLDDVDDCDEITSPCCGAQVFTVFGTLPLLVRCSDCDKQYKMGELVRNLLKNAETGSGV